MVHERPKWFSNLSKKELIARIDARSDKAYFIGDSREYFLHGVNLSNTKLVRIGLSDTTMIGANLSNTDLTEADLFNANLTNANLTNAKVSRNQLGQCTARPRSGGWGPKFLGSVLWVWLLSLVTLSWKAFKAWIAFISDKLKK
jgi:hypothetical protein